jgi:hypothetical protein
MPGGAVGKIIIMTILAHDGNRFFKQSGIALPGFTEDSEKNLPHFLLLMQAVKPHNIKKLHEF